MDKQLLKELAIARHAISSSYSNINIAKDALEKTQEYIDLQALKEEQNKWALEEANLTKIIKEKGEAEYLATKEKPSLVGLGLRVNKLLKYDLDKVTEWAKENAKMLFVLDVKAFEKLAKNSPVPGVEIVDDPMITISSDLSEYLEA